MITTPVLLHGLGVERWGLFTLAMTVAGMFGVLDLGIGAALTRALAERIDTEEERSAAALTTTALLVLCVIGTLGSLAVYAAVPMSVEHFLHVPAQLRHEAIVAFRVLALAGPLIVLNAALWGVLTAYQQFRVANLVSIPVNCFYYIGPALTLWIEPSLVAAIIALIVGRFAQTLIYLALALRAIPNLRQGLRFDIQLLRGLARIGTWITISSTLAPVLFSMDRLIVVSMLSLAGVSYYSTPLDLVSRLIIIPVSISTAFFPAVATSYRMMPARAGTLLRIGILATILMVFPACLLVVGFARELLTLWLGREFAAASYQVLTILGVGVFFICVSVLPGVLMDAIGRPDVGAKLLIAQVLLFPLLLVGLVRVIGIEGAALSWTARCILTCVGRFYLCGRFYHHIAHLIPTLLSVTLFSGAGLATCAAVGLPALRGAMVMVIGPIVILCAIAKLLNKDERLYADEIVRARLSQIIAVRAVDRM